ncbi:PREDICTED: quinone oxidoreductase-like protein 2 [Ceratosolen solmsi marchali]|uniref:Quinone oxidoreductase-like protein 2 n=1 Tax=Ceratosolen solmsi marchali TaxID=326594 RepID=A0AAJ7DTH2_9HYME|nr:PREDICTED: quinone oxidoreductase-like protein 2 [Ceratosolen solmsi marchali]
MLFLSSRQLFSRVFNNNNNRFIKYLYNVRLKTYSDKKESDKEKSTKMEIAVLNKFSESLEIERVDFPKISHSEEVIIDVNYCALNGLDVLLCENLYSYEQNLPFIPGYEIAGKLIEVGEKAGKAGYNVGDKVVALNKKRFGGLAERCVAEMSDVWKISTSIKSVDAVCLLENYMTALIGLEQFGCISENDMVLVNVGIGGIGLSAVDIAANIFKAKVLGVGFSEDRADEIRNRGAFHAFTYKEKKLINEIKNIAQERDIKNIFEGDSGENFKKVLNSFMNVYKSKTPSKSILRDDNFGVVVQHLSYEGRIIIAGVADVNLKINGKENDNAFVITGVNLRDYKKRKHDFYRQTGDDVISFFEEGLIKPKPSLVTGFYKVNEAKKFIYDMKACGKVVIDMKNKEAENMQAR